VRELPQPDTGSTAENSRKSSREQTAAPVQDRRRNLTKKEGKGPVHVMKEYGKLEA